MSNFPVNSVALSIVPNCNFITRIPSLVVLSLLFPDSNSYFQIYYHLEFPQQILIMILKGYDNLF